jgi:pimeloyl-ACP methyl ester carboxylesterase
MTTADVRVRSVATNGIELQVLEAGPEDGPPVVLAHGFPELAYSWRHQIPALAAAGYRVMAPDQRGYGDSSRPESVESYDITQLCGDLSGLLDDIGRDDAVFVGHDWGSMVIWNLALIAPERVRAVVGMSVPFVPRPAIPPTQLMRNMVGDSFFYILYFQQPGVADADLAADPATTLRRMLAGLNLSESSQRSTEELISAMTGDERGFVERLAEPERLPGWLTQDELDHYVEVYERTGFTGGINWYRNFDRNWELTEQFAEAHVTMPSLFIAGRADPVLLMSPPMMADQFLDDHRGNVLIDGAGHWVQQETPELVNDALLGFLDDLDNSGVSTPGELGGDTR